MSEQPIKAGKVAPGEYAPAGEAQGEQARFAAAEIAAAFGVEPDRVRRALAGEFGLAADATVDSRQAQQLAEALLTDQPLAEREAALMQLGAYTPRPDQMWGYGDKAPEDSSEMLGDDTGLDD